MICALSPRPPIAGPQDGCQDGYSGALGLIESALFSYLFWIEREYRVGTRLSPSD
jgi:hypothetical protein